MNNLRLFIGIAVAASVTDRLSSTLNRMTSELPFRKWTHPADLHVTLHFLGDTPAARLDAIRAAMPEAAAVCPPLSLALTEPGTFGPPYAPRILWLGVAEPASPGALARLHAGLSPGLAAAGFALDERPFRAHVTLARQGGAGCTGQAIQAAWESAGEAGKASSTPLAWTADRITLFQSHLGRRPSYEKIYECPFASPSF